ncbi:MAG: hypothetical protein ABR525_01495 [Candidatus Limnocylindria bacterium]
MDDFGVLTGETMLDLMDRLREVTSLAEMGIPPIRALKVVGKCPSHGTQLFEVHHWPGQTTLRCSFTCIRVRAAGGTCGAPVKPEALIDITADW